MQRTSIRCCSLRRFVVCIGGSPCDTAKERHCCRLASQTVASRSRGSCCVTDHLDVPPHNVLHFSCISVALLYMHEEHARRQTFPDDAQTSMRQLLLCVHAEHSNPFRLGCDWQPARLGQTPVQTPR